MDSRSNGVDQRFSEIEREMNRVIDRHKLVLSPEEEFAVSRGAHGHPEREGYGTTSVASTTKVARP